MPIPHTKAALLQAIESGFSKLHEELLGVEAARVTERSIEGHVRGSQMSAIDLLAYLVGWNELVLKWLDRDASGRAVDLPETGFKWNELGKLAQKFYRDYQDLPFHRLMTRLARAKGRIVAHVQSRSDRRLYGTRWYRKYTLGRMIQLNTAAPYANALRRLRTWKRRARR